MGNARASVPFLDGRRSGQNTPSLPAQRPAPAAALSGCCKTRPHGWSSIPAPPTKAMAEAAGPAVRELTPGQQAFVTFPNNVAVEIQEDTAISGESEFSHFHLSVPDPNGTYIELTKGLNAE